MKLKKNVAIRDNFSWLLLLFIPVVLYVFLDIHGADHSTAIFCAICSASVSLWLFARVPDFLPALLALVMLLLFDLTPVNVTLSGFSSPFFLLALSLMGIGIIVVQSGLVLRTGNFLLRHMSLNSFSQQWAIIIVGFLYQSFAFNDSRREKMVLPILPSIAETWNESQRQNNTTMLTSTALDSVYNFSPIILLATPANLIVLAFLGSQEQVIFSFSFWLYAASLTAVLMLILHAIVTAWYFKPLSNIKIDGNAVKECFPSPGPISSSEWRVLFAIIILVIGIFTQNLHQQSLANLFLAVLLILLTMSGKHWKEYMAKINWDFLLLFASVLSIYSVMKNLRLDFALLEQLGWLSHFISEHFLVAVLLLAGLTVMLRKVMSTSVVTIILSFVFLPLSFHAGVNPWILGFIILLFASTPRIELQNNGDFWDKSDSAGLTIDTLRINNFQNIFILVKLIAIYLSIPFWQVIGLL